MLVQSRVPKTTDKVKLYPEEFCYSVYMPIRADDQIWAVPKSVKWANPLLFSITLKDLREYDYVYLTVKHMITCGYQNRDGWHIDGFGSDDINYIWCSSNPTQVCVQDFEVSEDHNQSLLDMAGQALPKNVVTLDPETVYRLDTSVVHRCPLVEVPTLRTFVKISLSNEVYNLKGNASNPLLTNSVFDSKVERNLERNHPVGGIV